MCDYSGGERAMVIKTHRGDWAVLVGFWKGLRPGIPGTPSEWLGSCYYSYTPYLITPVFPPSISSFSSRTVVHYSLYHPPVHTLHPCMLQPSHSTVLLSLKCSAAQPSHSIVCHCLALTPSPLPGPWPGLELGGLLLS